MKLRGMGGWVSMLWRCKSQLWDWLDLPARAERKESWTGAWGIPKRMKKGLCEARNYKKAEKEQPETLKTQRVKEAESIHNVKCCWRPWESEMQEAHWMDYSPNSHCCCSPVTWDKLVNFTLSPVYNWVVSVLFSIQRLSPYWLLFSRSFWHGGLLGTCGGAIWVSRHPIRVELEGQGWWFRRDCHVSGELHGREKQREDQGGKDVLAFNENKAWNSQEWEDLRCVLWHSVIRGTWSGGVGNGRQASEIESAKNMTFMSLSICIFIVVLGNHWQF